MLTLRPYQQTLLRALRDAIRMGQRRICLQLSTGAGKTCIAAILLQGLSAKGNCGWFINHRREILRQSVTTLSSASSLSLGIVQAGVRLDPRELIQVCSIGSLVRRLPQLPAPHVIILDECHHTASKSWSSLLEKFPDAVVIGLTATPARLDGQGLGRWFDRLIEGPTTQQLIAQGYLAPYRLVAPPSHVDLSGVHTVAGDYNKSEASTAMQASTVVGDALSEYRQRCDGKRALLFLWSVEASKAIAERFTAAGIPAAHVDGTTPERERDGIMARFKAAALRVLSNVDLVSEGFDVPALDAVFLLRPTASLGLYLQQVGRALRPAEGKTALIVDHVGNYTRHGLPDDERVWSLDGAVGKERSELKVKTCPRCYAVERVWVAVCSQCAHRFVVVAAPREVEQVEGNLVEIDPLVVRYHRAREEGECRTLEQLVALGAARGYKPGWAVHRWDARQRRRACSISTGRGCDQ